MRREELLLTLFVLTAAIVVGAAGGLWLATRGMPVVRQEAVHPAGAPNRDGHPMRMASEPGKADSTPSLIPTAAAQEVEGKPISIGFPTVRTIRHAFGLDRTVIAIELQSATLERAAQLHNPERVYFDLAERGRAGRPKGRLVSRREVTVVDDRLARIRAVRWESGSVRIVADLKRPCEYSYRLSPQSPSVLTLELRTGPRSPVASRRPEPQGAARGAGELAANRP